MRAKIQNRAVTFSQNVYQRLLKAYPRIHRVAYGAAMEQLFRDQCRDAWRESQLLGLIKLWLHVLPDLVKTSVVERIASLRERKSMLERITEILRRPSFPIRTFAIVFAVVFTLIFGYTMIVTYLLPDSFAGSARITIEPSAGNIGLGKNAPADATYYDSHLIQTEFEVIQSDIILSSVVQDLNLNAVWGKKYAGKDAELKTSESVRLLKGRLDLRPVRNTSLIDIRAFSEDRMEAAAIANTVAENYRAFNAQQSKSVSIKIVEHAVPGIRPVHPNRPLNIVLGVLWGSVIGLVVAGSVAMIAFWILRKPPIKPAAP